MGVAGRRREDEGGRKQLHVSRTCATTMAKTTLRTSDNSVTKCAFSVVKSLDVCIFCTNMYESFSVFAYSWPITFTRGPHKLSVSNWPPADIRWLINRPTSHQPISIERSNFPGDGRKKFRIAFCILSDKQATQSQSKSQLT